MEPERKKRKQYRLPSLLKLQIRIVDDLLMKQAEVHLEYLRLIEAINFSASNAKGHIYDAGNTLLKYLAFIGRFNSTASNMASRLNTSSTQEELKEFYQFITSRQVEKDVEEYFKAKVITEESINDSTVKILNDLVETINKKRQPHDEKHKKVTDLVNSLVKEILKEIGKDKK